MGNKKRYIIALVLFLLIGLTLYSFANPALEQTGSDKNKGNGKESSEVSDKKNNTETDNLIEVLNPTQVVNQQPVDNTYALALAALEKAEKTLAEELADVDSKTLAELIENARELIQVVTNDASKTQLTERADVVEESLEAIELVAQLQKLVEDALNKEDIIDAIDYRTLNEVNEVVENLKNEEVKEVLVEILEDLNLILDDKNAPSYDGINDNETTNEDVTLTITDETEVKVVVMLNDEEIEYIEGEAFTKEGLYEVTLIDEAYNEVTFTFTIDKTQAGLISANAYTNGFTYTVDKHPLYYVTNGNKITAYVRLSEQLKEVPTFTFVVNETNVVATVKESFHNKQDKENGVYKYEATLLLDKDVELEDGTLTFIVSNIIDKAGNKSKDVKGVTNKNVVVVDRTAPKPHSTTYSPKTITNGDVTVTIKVSEELQEVEGWTLSSDKKAISKTFAKNVNGNVEIKDLAGNKVKRYYSIKNIDKVAPEATVTTSNNNGNWSTNKDVTATLKTNEAIVTPEGWTVVTEGYEFTKVYAENGKYSVEIEDIAGNTSTIKFEVKRIDKVAPEVTVISPNKYQLEVHSEYVDKGYSAYDKVDKDVTKLIKITYQFQAKGTSAWPFVDELDTSKLGTYKVIYTAYDKAGNTAKATRVVEIVDTTSPLLSLNGEDKITLEAGIDTYLELGATATDNYDETINNISVDYINYRDKDNNFMGKVDKVDTTKLGTYKIVYTHTDSNGNVGVDASRSDHNYVMRTVVVEDTTAPQMTINGEKQITLEAGNSTYTELGVTVTDNVDETITNLQPKYINYTDLDGKLTKVSEVDTTKVGTYKVVYEYVDSSNNKAVDSTRNDHAYIIRVVKVVDTIAPTLTVKKESIGTNPYFSEVSFALSDSNKIDYFLVNGVKFDRTDAKYSDANYQNIKSAVVAGENKIVLYDTAKNSTELTFYMDWTIPTITVKNWYGSNPYSGADFSISDNYAIDYFLVNGTKYDRTNAKYSDANYQNIKNSLVNGENEIVLYDAAGNHASYKFDLERVAPTIKVVDTSVGTDPYKKLNLKLHDASGISSVVINGTKLPHKGVWVDINDGHAYTFHEGNNVVVVKDNAGNTTTKTFVVDRTHYVYTFADLKEAYAQGGKAKLMNDIEIPETLKLDYDKALVLDMNQKTIRLSDDSTANVSSSPVMKIYPRASLTITGNGTFDLEDNYNAVLMYPWGDVTILNGNFLKNAGGTGYDSMFAGINNGTGKLIIKDGYFDFGYYNALDESKNGEYGLNLSVNQYVRVYGGTFVGQNLAYGDEAYAATSPKANPTKCQGVFFEGQTVNDTEIPSTYEIVDGIHADGRPTYTIKYTPNN